MSEGRREIWLGKDVGTGFREQDSLVWWEERRDVFGCESVASWEAGYVYYNGVRRVRVDAIHWWVSGCRYHWMNACNKSAFLSFVFWFWLCGKKIAL